MPRYGYWDLRWERWPGQRDSRGPETPGYTMLIPVPGDLPVFLRLALDMCARQSAEHRVSTLIIPDKVTGAMARITAEARRSWDGELVLRYLPMPERWILPRLKTGWRNHGLQVITGAARARSTHIILHDADLFLLTPDLLDSHYRECRDRNLDCLGVSPVWDPWFAAHGRNLAATWELCARVAWMRSFPPRLHVGHQGFVLGESHGCDTTLHPQAASPPEAVAVHDRDADFVHFNNVIGTYRRYQLHPKGFVDDRFRLLLIRLFIDLFDGGSSEYAVPDTSTLVKGLRSDDAPVGYPSATDGRDAYREFRVKLARVLAGPWTVGDSLPATLLTFDEYYGYP